jgi:hypothetical protein
MKNFTPALIICVGLGISATAQKFTLLPQVGLETSKPVMRFNNFPSFVPDGQQLSSRLGVRMDYATKKFGGPYVGIAASRSTVAVKFDNPETGMSITNVSAGDKQIRMEAGYQISSKPFYVTKPNGAKKAKAMAEQQAAAIALEKAASTRRRCGGYSSSSYQAADRLKKATEALEAANAEKGWFVSIQPSVGYAYVPFAKSSISTMGADAKSGFTYLAGNMKSAFVAGTGLEIGRDTERKLNLTVQYIKGVGNLNESSVITQSGSKSTVTTLNSSVSAWNVSVGIPISLSKKKVAVKPEPVIKEKKARQHHGQCSRYSRYMQS